MTVQEAIAEIRRVGSVRAENGKLKARFPESERARLQPAIEALRQNRNAALKMIGENPIIPPDETFPESLRELAEERAAVSCDPEAARQEVWISYQEWKARELNRLFDERGVPEPRRKPAEITAEILHGGTAYRAQGKGKP